MQFSKIVGSEAEARLSRVSTRGTNVVDLSQYTAYLSDMTEREVGQITLTDEDSKRTVRRHLTNAAAQLPNPMYPQWLRNNDAKFIEFVLKPLTPEAMATRQATKQQRAQRLAEARAAKNGNGSARSAKVAVPA